MSRDICQTCYRWEEEALRRVAAPIVFATYDAGGNRQEHEIEVSEGDRIGEILAKIPNQDNNLRAFFDLQTERVILEATRTGVYHEGGTELEFAGTPFLQRLEKNLKSTYI